MAALQFFLPDGLNGAAIATVLGEDTQYARDYSESAFRNIEAGMSEHQVRSLLGEPLTKMALNSNGESWRYTKSPSDSHYHLRSVVFRDHAVVRIFHEFYVD